MKISVLGAGTWGMALARMLSVNGHDVTVYSSNSKSISQLDKTRRHKNLEGMIIPDKIVFTDDIKSACIEKDILVFAVPSVGVRNLAESVKEYIKDNQLIVDVAKGIETDTLLTMSEVIKDVLKDKNVTVVALSGPTHAEEVAKDMPTTIVSACKDLESAKLVQKVFSNDCMRVYTNDDVLGVELCGALKNIIALASGISTGLGFGDNAKAAIITRGVVEINRSGLAMGADKDTFSGLAGIGDLIVTCASVHSRNRKAGVLMGQGKTMDEAMKEVKMVVEGVYSAKAAMLLSKKYNVSMPIIEQVNLILFENKPADEAVKDLMFRDKRVENSVVKW